MSAKPEGLDRLIELLNHQLEGEFDDDAQQGFRDFQAVDEANLDVEIATEARRLQREEQLLQDKKEKLKSEKERLTNFAMSREAIEREEAAEAAKKLHRDARTYLSGTLAERRKLPQILSVVLKEKERELQAQYEGMSYMPGEDDFLVALSKQLEPVLAIIKEAEA
ncbi:MAG: hypothetical protein CYPHOPRED_000236 [Cyphobasidiales sp. Tagirdzhanova-0007]|nr:MAG: hypothetical protein CYPHOPRED_000236 [Cyphobasidiales sp. Tagirdzhanova-0007]